jgi:flagellar hook-associated protein 1 FlgK
MGNLFTSLVNSTGALRVYGRSFNVIQNNITNANTPGYVKQDQVLLSLPFDPSRGLAGGVVAGPMVNARSSFLEQSVRGQNQLLGEAQQHAKDLGVVEGQFDLTSTFGVSSALNGFFNGFSQLAVNPNDTVSRQGILDLGGQAASAFQQAAIGLQSVSTNVDRQTRDSVATINRLAGQIAGINRVFRSSAGAAADAGMDAQLNAALEELAEVAHYSLIRTSDGAANVYLGGQTILVMGDRDYPITADLSTPETVIRDAAGTDITGQIRGGRLGALVEEKNTTLPGYLSDLNAVAVAFADNVNATLAQGVDRNGLPPPFGLFSYNPAAAAATLEANPLIPDQIAAALATAPGGNGNAIALAQLGSAPVAGGFTLSQAFGALGAKVGRDVSNARNEQAQYQDTLAQARLFRKEATGVSLDEEAAKVLQFQQAYQAIGKLITVINELTDSLMAMIR